MSTILLSNRSFDLSRLQDHCGLRPDQLLASTCTAPHRIESYRPYLIGCDSINGHRGVMSLLSPLPVATPLTHLGLSYGDENVIALAAMVENLRAYGIGAIGTSTALYANRVQGFVGSVQRYQTSLLEYREAVKSKASNRVVAKQRAHADFDRMQRDFQHELRVVSGRVRARRGTPFTSAERATNIASSSRNIVRLNLTGMLEATWLVKLIKHARFLGNGAALIDFGGRAGNIHNAYKAGASWERELFIESVSFLVEAMIARVFTAVAPGVLGFFVVATPVGWVGVVVGGLALAGIGSYFAVNAGSGARQVSGQLYDVIMRELL